jgi:hypothetical protein
MVHGGVTIYNLYKDDDSDSNPPSDLFFTTNRRSSYDDFTEDNGNFDVRDLDAEDLIEKSKPPYMTNILNDGEANPDWTNASPERRDEIAQEWKRWHAGTEVEITKKVIMAAIDRGEIKPWKDEE